MKIKLSELANMPNKERDAKLKELVTLTRSKTFDIDSFNEIKIKLNDFEKKYGFTSDEVHDKIDSSEIRETQEICEWLLLFDLYKKILKRKF